MKYIIENGEQLDVADNVAANLEAAQLIYSCDCTGGAFHIKDGRTWEEVMENIDAKH